MPTLPCPFPLAKVLACTDDSPASQGAGRVALDLAQACGGRVLLLHILEFFPYVEYPQPDALGLPPPVAQDFLAWREQAAKEHLENWQQEASEQGVELEGLLRVGGPAHAEIVAAGEELQPDLIVMGRRGKSGLERLLVGSVTARVIGHTSRKVMVAPRDTILTLNRLLLASDGSPASQAACQEARTIAQRTEAHLTAVTATHGDLDPKRAKDLVKHLTAEAHQRNITLNTLTPGGQPDEAIIQVATAKRIDLIIMGSHGRTGLKRLFLGSVAERVIGQAPCPVLVVKGGG